MTQTKLDCKTVTNGGQTAAVAESTACGIQEADGNPDADLVMIISQPEVWRALGRLVVQMLFMPFKQIGTVIQWEQDPVDLLSSCIYWGGVQKSYPPGSSKYGKLIEAFRRKNKAGMTEEAYSLQRVNRKIKVAEAKQRLIPHHAFPGTAHELFQVGLDLKKQLKGRKLVAPDLTVEGMTVGLTVTDALSGPPILNLYTEQELLPAGTVFLLSPKS